jgi:hypothetical protein
MKTGVLLLLFLFSAMACRKKDDIPDPCTGKTMNTARFAAFETVGDTLFRADSVYRDNFVQFHALGSYDSVRWRIGSDPRNFTQSLFHLSFANTLGSLSVGFTAYAPANPICFPEDNGVYTGSASLTILEQVDRSLLTLSPLIGKYQGAFTDQPSDTFTIRIEYFDSTKYSPNAFGAKNFYWISNIPKGYYWPFSSQTFSNPELQHGKELNMGYKSFQFYGATCENGKGWLSNDTLFINYGSPGCRRKFIAKRI